MSIKCTVTVTLTVTAAVTVTDSSRAGGVRKGSVAVFEDLYGNRWDLIEPRR